MSRSVSAHLKLLFIHGLEGHPNGAKVRMLRAQGFEVRAEDMQMSLMRFGKRNSALRNALRLPEVRFFAAVFVLALVLCVALDASPFLFAAVLASPLWLALRRRALVRGGLAKSFDVCVEVQRRALREDAPDILVGSSWGGAVAAELLVRGDWTGPTVLLAPAIERVDFWARRGTLARTTEALRRIAAAVPLVVFHDPSDEVVPYADSARLTKDSPIELRSVDAGGHRLLALLERGELAQLLLALKA